LAIPPTPRNFVSKDVGIKAEITPSLNEGKIVLNGTFDLTTFEGMTQSNLGPETPSFDTREIHFFEAMEENRQKGVWVPGLRTGEMDVATGQTDSTGRPTYKKKPALMRMILFVSANQVPSADPH